MRLGAGPGVALLLLIWLIDRKLLQSSDHGAARCAGQIGANRRLLRHALRGPIRGFARHHFGCECRRCGDSSIDVRLSCASLSALAQRQIAVAIIALIVHSTATPVAGIGIAVPVFVPVVVTAILGLLVPRICSAAGLYRRIHGNVDQAPIFSISTRSAALARRSLPSAARAHLTAYS